MQSFSDPVGLDGGNPGGSNPTDLGIDTIDEHAPAGDPSGTTGPPGRTGRRPPAADSLPVVAGAAVAMAGVGAALALADIGSPLRAPFTLFFLLVAPACGVAAALRGLDPLSRAVVAGGGAVAVDLLVAQTMLALHSWSVRGGVAAVGAVSLLLFLLAHGWHHRSRSAKSRTS
ncbi:hypothetical protein I5Q34_20420 [Streptomyces sp. AV19]|uniref:hypothetical protein n=1 Tax=Streptomyces sp. AV19 TaxID=2793068 RepID=UPI0018FE2CDE|nr:hypothetical protein [Streptomyces sp. AV19]MBH1936613.1 hypothetical protein [Streptomyces sp. AV19]MDG4532675.1 hypothetical protein [Streptomyces sp. AV19]